MTFTESNTVEAYLHDLLAGPFGRHAVRDAAGYGRGRLAVGWQPLTSTEIPRQPQEVFVEPFVRAALIRLNPAIAAQPERADEVLYRLRAIVLSVRSDGLVKANEEFTAWLRGERSMPFGPNHEHVTVRLIDFEDLEHNQYIVTTQYVFRAGPAERRADLVLLINGLPLILIEAKTPVRPAVSWVDAALQIHENYEQFVPELFACNVFSVATEGKELRFGSIRMPINLWGPWRMDEDAAPGGFSDLQRAVAGLLDPATVLDILANFTLFATDQKKRRLKIIITTIFRFGEDTPGQRVHRLLNAAKRDARAKRGASAQNNLDQAWTLARTLDPADAEPIIEHIVKLAERLKLKAPDATRPPPAPTEQDADDTSPVLNDRHNIIALVDEAHRTQEGDLGMLMRLSLPNAFLFGLTGTPINSRDRNTFYAFGAEEDEHGYLSRYGFDESIRDGATLPLHFEPRQVDLHIDKAAIDTAYAKLTGNLSDLDRDNLAKMASKLAVLVKAPKRIAAICEDIAKHFQSKVEPNGFKGLVVTFDQDCCLLYKAALDQHFPPEASEIVISVAGKDKNDEQYKPYKRDRDAEEALLDRYRDPKDPLKLLIVTAKLLTGFDAPILQAMYLDKPLRDHTLLQAITRTNRTYGGTKSHGLIVDYLGVFDDVDKALAFDDQGVKKVVTNIAALKDQLPGALQKCLAYFSGVDRAIGGYEGLIAAQECLPDNATRDAFAADYSVVGRLWEALSPDPLLDAYRDDYRWLSQVYESVKPSTGHGALLWHVLGAKTIALIHENVKVGTIHDDLDQVVFDADVIEAILDATDKKKKAKEIEIKVAARLRKHLGNPRFKRLSERLEKLKERHETGQLHSIAFLKELLELARELVAAEKETPPEEDENRGKAALTELFQEARNPETPVVVERVVNDIDEIVRVVRFPGWQQTSAGEREVKKALRKALFKYKLHSDLELFEKAYGYVRQYY